MKKTIAAGGAAFLGLSTVGLGALPAQAADEPVTEACTDINQHDLAPDNVGSNWYMDCIPQYALGKVDFTITSATPFPDDFLPLNDPAVTSTATSGDAGATYIGATEPPAGFDYLDFQGSDETSQHYEGTMIFPITSVGPIATDALPDACQVEGSSYTGAYVVNFAPTSVTFTQVVDGVEWRYDVVTEPQPLYLGLSILADGSFDFDGSMCASANGTTTLAVDGPSSTDNQWSDVAERATSFEFDGESLMPFFGEGKSLPDVSRYVAPPEPKPQLAATGVSPAPALGVAALFLALGVAGGHLKRRRSAAS